MTDDWILYDLPEHLLGKIWKGKYRGQKQKWALMRFHGSDADIDIATEHPEFTEWKWMAPDELVGEHRALQAQRLRGRPGRLRGQDLMRALLLSAPILALATQASALSCLPPDAVVSYQRADQAPETYVVLLGDFRFDPPELPGRDLTDPNPVEHRFPAQFEGQALGPRGSPAAMPWTWKSR